MVSIQTHEFGDRAEHIELIEKRTTKTTRGMLSKAWYMIDGELCLVKGNSPGGWEPFSEVMSFKLGEKIGFNIVPYWLEDASRFPEVETKGACNKVSVCKTFMQPGEVQAKLAYFIEDVLGQSVESWIAANALDAGIQDILLFDALIGNEDRHLNNIDLLFKDGAFSRVAPIYDCGAGLLAWCADCDLGAARIPYKLDNSKPFRARHKAQLGLIDSGRISGYFAGVRMLDLVDAIESELEELPAERSKAIVSFLTWRLRMIQSSAESERGR